MEQKLYIGMKVESISESQAIQIAGSEKELAALTYCYTRECFAVNAGYATLAALVTGAHLVKRSAKHALRGTPEQIQETLKRLSRGERELLLSQAGLKQKRRLKAIWQKVQDRKGRPLPHMWTD